MLLLFARDPVTLIIFGSVTGAGIGMYITSNWALANQLAPKQEAGMYLGLTNIATAGAGAVARLAGPVIDIVNNAFPGRYWGYSLLFILAAVFALLSLVLLRKVTTKPEGMAA